MCTQSIRPPNKSSVEKGQMTGETSESRVAGVFCQTFVADRSVRVANNQQANTGIIVSECVCVCMCVSVCVCVCVCERENLCVCACVRACMRACKLSALSPQVGVQHLCWEPVCSCSAQLWGGCGALGLKSLLVSLGPRFVYCARPVETMGTAGCKYLIHTPTPGTQLQVIKAGSWQRIVAGLSWLLA